MKLSERATRISPSATLSLSAKAKAMAQEGKPVIVFSAGEPDFNTPMCANEAAIAAIERGETKYTPTVGILPLREEVSKYYKNRFDLHIPPSRIVVGNGGKPLIYEALQAAVDPGDEVLLFTPAWVSYVEQIRMCDGKEVLVETLDTGLVPTEERILAAITPATKGVIVNTPCNPTGAVYNKATLQMIAGIARKHNLWIIFDEIYERLTYGGAEHHNFLNVAPDLEGQTLIVNGVSKTYSMTGWRIGFAMGPADWIKGINLIQDHLSSNPSSIAQWAALGALRGGNADVEMMCKAFEARRNSMMGYISEMPNVSFVEPEGAFYLFVDISKTPVPDDVVFSQRLLEEKMVAMVPGSAFFAPGHLRISYANSQEDIDEGMKRLDQFLHSLK